MINRQWFSTTACGYVDKSRKVIHNLDRQTTSPSEVPCITRYLNTRTTSLGEVPQQVKHLGRRTTSSGEVHRQMIHLDRVGCQMVCHIDLALGLCNEKGATFGATFLQRSYNKEGSYEL